MGIDGVAEEIDQTGMMDVGEDFNLVFGGGVGGGGLGNLDGGDEVVAGAEKEVGFVDAAVAALAEEMGLGEGVGGGIEIGVGEEDDLVGGR